MKTYIQVAYLLPSRTTVERETTPLLSVKDNYPKLLLTLDLEVGNDFEGVQRLYLPDWLDNSNS